VATDPNDPYHANTTDISIAEALAVFAGGTLIMAATGAPFLHYWNYSEIPDQILDPPQVQGFNATIQTEDYSSGGAQPWQGIFYIVLVTAFATNVFCLVYLFENRCLIADFTEPQNLFALAVNSPPSNLMAHSCGAGPDAQQFKLKWAVDMQADEHFKLICTDRDLSPVPAVNDGLTFKNRGGDWEIVESETAELRRLRDAKSGFSNSVGVRRLAGWVFR
jgi:hypothetical protein